MALVRVSSPQRVPPDRQLTEALHDLDRVLSDEQRLEVRAAGSLTATSALELAIRVDRECNENRRQCMGARFTLFIDSLRQFYDATDTFVSSNPTRAALVWGGLKVTILVRQAPAL